MKVLLTGGNGMLAKSIAKEWNRLGMEGELNPITRSDVDLRDREATARLVRRQSPDVIIHTAARVGGISANIADPAGFLMDNLLLDTSLLSAATEVGIKDLVYVGSSCMYPRNYRQPLAESDILAAPLEPTNEGYALAKITAAKYCQYASQQYDLNYRVIIPSNLYGPSDHYSLESAHLVAAALAKVHRAKIQDSPSVSVWGDGTARREFTFVVDLARWIVSNLARLGDLPPLLNLGLGADYSVKEIYETAMQTVGYQGVLEFDASKPTGMRQKLMDSSAARQFGWEPRTGLSEGMELSYQEYLRELAMSNP